MSELTRKQFLSLVAKTTAVVAAIPMVAACGGDDDASDGNDNGGGGDCLANGTQVVIAANHSHMLTVSAADVEAGAEKSFTLSNVGHEHEITISADHFAQLQGGTSVTVVSTSDGTHTHSVTINCA